MSDGGLTRLARGAVVYGAGEVLNRIASFVLLPVLTRYLTPEDYGTNALLAMYGLVASSVFTLGITASMALSYFEPEPGRREETLGTATALLFSSGTVLVALGGTYSGLVARLLFGHGGVESLVLVSTIGVALSIASAPLRLALQFEDRAGASVLVTCATTIVSVAGALGLVVGLRRGVAGLVEANAAAQAVGLALAALTLRSRPRWSSGVARALLLRGVPMLGSNALVFVIMNASRYALQLGHGTGAVGVFAVGANLGQSLAVAVSGFQNAWVPYFMTYAARPESEGRSPLGRVLTYYVLGAGMSVLALHLSARVIVLLVTAPAFHGAWRVVGLTATAHALLGVFSVLLPQTYFAKELPALNLVQAGAAVAAVVASALLVPPLGPHGAALALACGTAALCALQHGWNRIRGSAYRAVDYEPRRVASMAAAFAAVLAAGFAERSWSLAGEALFASLAMMMILAAALALLTPAERTMLREAVRRATTSRAERS